MVTAMERRSANINKDQLVVSLSMIVGFTLALFGVAEVLVTHFVGHRTDIRGTGLLLHFLGSALIQLTVLSFWKVEVLRTRAILFIAAIGPMAAVLGCLLPLVSMAQLRGISIPVIPVLGPGVAVILFAATSLAGLIISILILANLMMTHRFPTEDSIYGRCVGPFILNRSRLTNIRAPRSGNLRSEAGNTLKYAKSFLHHNSFLFAVLVVACVVRFYSLDRLGLRLWDETTFVWLGSSVLNSGKTSFYPGSLRPAWPGHSGGF